MRCVKKHRREALASWQKATENGFKVGTYEELIPRTTGWSESTPDKQHSDAAPVQPLMKDGAALGYSHGFNIVEVGEQIRKDITVVMVAPKARAPKCGEEYNAVSAYRRLSRYTRKTTRKCGRHGDCQSMGCGDRRHRAGVLESSFVAEVKSDPMGGTNHPFWYAVRWFSAVLRQAGGGRYRSGVCAEN